MTFKEKYDESTAWVDRVLIMEIYHLVMISRHPDWTVSQLARDFQCSIGLASENLRLANLIHAQPAVLKIESRNEALKKLR